MFGAFLGFLLEFVLRPLATPIIFIYCIFQWKYPWWMITPDDLPRPGFPHFGYYEPTVRKVYTRFGKRLGDFYWLGFRNVLYGLRHAWKPKDLMPQPYWPSGGVLNYGHLVPYMKRRKMGRVTFYSVLGYKMITIRWFSAFGRTYWGGFGWKVDRIVDDPYTERAPINMDARPMFVPIRV